MQHLDQTSLIDVTQRCIWKSFVRLWEKRKTLAWSLFLRATCGKQSYTDATAAPWKSRAEGLKSLIPPDVITVLEITGRKGISSGRISRATGFSFQIPVAPTCWEKPSPRFTRYNPRPRGENNKTGGWEKEAANLWLSVTCPVGSSMKCKLSPQFLSALEPGGSGMQRLLSPQLISA